MLGNTVRFQLFLVLGFPVLASAQVLLSNGADLDMSGSSGSQIIFPDGTTQSSALESGLSLPAGHGGVNSEVSGTEAFVGGGRSNTASGSFSSVVGGRANTASGNSGFIGGGRQNVASAPFTTVCGGGDFNSDYGNVATDEWGTIGGGSRNKVGDDDGDVSNARHATVAGGGYNEASNQWSTVGGGYLNVAAGAASTVPGGVQNEANATYSFAAGRLARANHEGAFVWGDSTLNFFESTADNEFSARATGGVRFVTNAGGTTGVTLAGGGSDWGMVSSKSAKENYEDVDPIAILEKLAGLRVQQWNYIANDDNVKHIGPYAEDFHGAFGLNGEYNGRLTNQDLNGVALAAIQGLDSKFESLVSEKQRRLDELESRLVELERRLSADAQ